MNIQFKSFGFQAIYSIALALVALIGLGSVSPSAAQGSQIKSQVQAEKPLQQAKLKQQLSVRKSNAESELDQKLRSVNPIDHDDLLLAKPNAKVEHDELADACEQVKCEIIATLGAGDKKVLVVKTEHGKAAQTQQKLLADGHFSAVDFNKTFKAH